MVDMTMVMVPGSMVFLVPLAFGLQSLNKQVLCSFSVASSKFNYRWSTLKKMWIVNDIDTNHHKFDIPEKDPELAVP